MFIPSTHSKYNGREGNGKGRRRGVAFGSESGILDSNFESGILDLDLNPEIRIRNRNTGFAAESGNMNPGIWIRNLESGNRSRSDSELDPDFWIRI